jgi:hypothetical protein
LGLENENENENENELEGGNGIAWHGHCENVNVTDCEANSLKKIK